MESEEYGAPLWRAGDIVPAGTYLRVDDHSYRLIVLKEQGQLPGSCDGHVAVYCQAPAVCLIDVLVERSRTLHHEQAS